MWHGSSMRSTKYKQIIKEQLDDLINQDVQIYLMHGNNLLKQDLSAIIDFKTLKIAFWSTVLENQTDLKYDEKYRRNYVGLIATSIKIYCIYQMVQDK